MYEGRQGSESSKYPRLKNGSLYVTHFFSLGVIRKLIIIYKVNVLTSNRSSDRVQLAKTVSIVLINWGLRE